MFQEPNESLGMRIGGGLGSNEGDIPIYIANIHPQGCVGRTQQILVSHSSFFLCTAVVCPEETNIDQNIYTIHKHLIIPFVVDVSVGRCSGSIFLTYPVFSTFFHCQVFTSRNKPVNHTASSSLHRASFISKWFVFPT